MLSKLVGNISKRASVLSRPAAMTAIPQRQMLNKLGLSEQMWPDESLVTSDGQVDLWKDKVNANTSLSLKTT